MTVRVIYTMIIFYQARYRYQLIYTQSSSPFYNQDSL